MNRFAKLLRQIGIEPVLVDAGASGTPPRIWREIGPQSTYIGFDPDSREFRTDPIAGFARSILVPRALVAREDVDATELYLTQSPFCSSTLPPRSEALSSYLFAPLFDVVGTTEVPATSMARLVADQQLASIDWLKLDTQGTDLRLYASVPEPHRSRILALDIEPGLIDAYEGEDLFVTAHDTLVRQGWWLSAARVNGTVRIARESVARLESYGLGEAAVRASARVTPAWVEARYLRTTEHLAQIDAGTREYQLLWCFAMIDRQFGFAFDVVEAYARRFPSSIVTETMREATLSALRRPRPAAMMQRILPTALRRSLGAILTRTGLR